MSIWISKTVLVVDNNQANTDSLVMLLNKFGCRTFHVNDTELGLGYAYSIVPDIIFHELNMLPMDGYAAAAMLRKDEQFQKTLLVAMVEFPSDQESERARSIGFDLYLHKPIDVYALKLILDRERSH
jgi:CheY-like chemotaxis protein